MKPQRISTRILLPALALLLLLPPLSCLIFQRAAERYAYSEATRQLHSLRQSLLPVLESSFKNAQAVDRQKQVQSFLQRVSRTARNAEGSANVLILEEQTRTIYPRDEQEQEELAPLRDVCLQHLASGGFSPDSGAVYLETSAGTTYLVDLYEVPSRSVQVKYLITYSPVSQIGDWVRSASLLVLIISSFFAILTLAVLWVTARAITHPLDRLRRESERIGSGDFQSIQPPFQLRELEELRRSMNRMSQMLLRSEEVQRDFFQNVSHDLRTPLMSIGGYAQGIETGVFPDPAPAAHTILEESARLTKLVNSLLTLSRLEIGEHAPSLEPVPLASPVEDCLDRLNGLALEHGVLLSLLPFDRSLRVIGEEELICNVLENLLTNAIRYASSTVTISIRSQGDRRSVTVADDGAGISDVDLPHLFDRCYKGVGGNFGIGLAIAQSAAQNMRGTLTAANLPSGGAAFTLTLSGA